MSDMNDSSYVPTNNQQPVVETPLATEDQFPQPTSIPAPARDGEYVAPVGLVDEPVDYTEADTPDGEALLQQTIEEGKKTGEQKMQVFGLDVPEPTDEELRQVEEEAKAMGDIPAPSQPAPKAQKAPKEKK